MQPRSGNPALKYGFIFGGIGAALSVVNAAIRATNPSTSISGGTVNATSSLSGLGCLFSLVSLALFFVAGILAARESGRVGQGSIAGLVAGLISGAVTAIAGIIQFLTLSDADLSAAAAQAQSQGSTISPQDLRGFIVGLGIVVMIVVLLILAGLGAGLGALGGLIGKNQYNGPAAQYQQSFYQGMPPQGYPQQPGYPPPPPTYPPTGGYPPAEGAPQYPPQYPPQQTPPQYPPQQ